MCDTIDFAKFNVVTRALQLKPVKINWLAKTNIDEET